MAEERNICDYSDTDYAADFWGENKRLYEDQVERIALRKVLPKAGKKFLDMGSGFGRLTGEYAGRFKEVVLFDYAQNLLDQAKNKYQDKKNITYVQGDMYHMPFADDTFDGGLSVRVMHHFEDVPLVLKELNRVMAAGSVFVLEYANKRNILEVARAMLGKENLSPFDRAPSQRGEKVFWNFHPKYIEAEVKKAGFKVEKVLSVSIFRSGFLKKLFGVKVLSFVERILQKPLGRFRLSPSVFIILKKE
jgi:ubiquinone/menaquinone biosynthesis C-methylase UbiE